MEQTLFVKMLGNSPRIRVLDMLITGRELDYSISDIAESADIGRPTFYGMLDELLQSGIIVPTRKFGRIQLYRINLNNRSVKQLVRFFDNLLGNASRNALERQDRVLMKGIKRGG